MQPSRQIIYHQPDGISMEAGKIANIGSSGEPVVVKKEVILIHDAVKAYVPEKKPPKKNWTPTMLYVEETDPVLIERDHHGRHQMPVVFKKPGDKVQLIFVHRFFYGLNPKGDFGKNLIFWVRVIKETFSDESVAVRLELFKRGTPQKIRPEFELKIREGINEGIDVPQFPQAKILFIPRSGESFTPKKNSATPLVSSDEQPYNVETVEGKLKIRRRRL
jgi:hypothetical protein